MYSWLNKVYFNNPLQDYLIFVVALLLILLLKRYLSKYIAGFIFQLFHKSYPTISRQVFVNLLKAPIHVFLVLLVIFISLDRMNYPRVLKFKINRIPFKFIVESTVNAILVIAFIWLLLRIIDFIATVMEINAGRSPGVSGNRVIIFFKDFFKVIIIFIGGLLIIRFAFHKDIAALLAGFGIVGFALAISIRESLENLIASFIIFFDKPFTQGDLVKIHSFTGTVERIGLRSTRIRTDQKTYLTVPNKQMVDSIVDNLTLRTQRKGTLTLEISADTAFEPVRQLVTRVESLLATRKEGLEDFSVVLSDVSKNSFVLLVEYFTPPVEMEVYNSIRQDLNLSIIQIMDEMKIKLAGKEG